MAQKAYNLLKILTLFSVGAICYGFMEILNRGYSHITMGVLGGASLLVIHILNGERKKGLRLWLVLGISALFITSIEFLSGEYLNRFLGLGIWSYEEMPLNFDGQICLPFAFLWFGLSYIGVLADNFLRRRIFKEQSIKTIKQDKLPAAV
ncbi:hypothetical protein [Ruminococcus sp.]|uniref:putative ABC transporter permease n=1 Tax=Ruminococcus sp. TaxID=41978 RepID=UPI0025FC0EFF|nr:hypothetical protein [Ruminococcus sp.]